MLKRIYIKKIVTCLVALFAILLIYMIPNNEETFSYKEEVEYVNKNIKTSTIFLLDSNNYLASTKIIIEKTNKFFGESLTVLARKILRNKLKYIYDLCKLFEKLNYFINLN